MTDRELDQMMRRLAEFAKVEGFTLKEIFVEQEHEQPAAFQALVDAANRDQVTAVVVPSMHHLGSLGAAAAAKSYLEHHTGARVMVAGSALERPPHSGR